MASKPAVLAGRWVTLRPPVMADFREFAVLMKNSDRFYRGLVSPFKGKVQFADYVRRSRNGESFRFLICRNRDGSVVGNISLFLITRNALQSACVGYMVGASHARRGYATGALQLVLHFAFDNLKLHRVEANIQPHNKPSLALVKRAGFKREGYSPRYLKICGKWRDHERWALLVENWHKS
ncbi:MAG: GNAT family protein [Verrucomicrobiia bacterium]